MASMSIAAAQPVISHAPSPAMVQRGGTSPPSGNNNSSLEPPQLSGRPLSQHSRDNRPQFLRATRPFTQTVRSHRTPHKTLTQSDQPKNAHGDKSAVDQGTFGIDGTCVDPLPLHASEISLRQPPSAAFSPVEWIVLRAQGLPVALDDLDLARPRTGPPRSPAAYLTVFERECRREALREEVQQLETMLRPQCSWPKHDQPSSPPAAIYPRCNWPRQGATLRQASAEVETAAIALAMLAVTDAASPGAFARCAWPRAQNSAAADLTVAGARCEWPRKAAAVAGARCEWPRKASAMRSAPAPFAMSPSTAAAARCAWPRSSPGASNGPRCAWPRPSALSALPGLSPAPAATIGAHCSWPHKSSMVSEGPRCQWPRSGFAPAGPGPRCNWPRAATAVASAETAPAEGPRCVWPRKLTSADVQALLVQAVLEAEAIAPEGPRCAWPRGSSAAPAAPAIPAAVTEGPRCAWPRMAPAVAAPIPAGPRCAWPRQTEATRLAAAAEELHGDMLPQIAREAGTLEAAGRVFERRRVRGITVGA